MHRDVLHIHITQGSVDVKHDSGSTDLFTRECCAPKTLHLELILAKPAFGQRTTLASATDSMHAVQTGQVGYKQK